MGWPPNETLDIIVLLHTPVPPQKNLKKMVKDALSHILLVFLAFFS